MGAIYRNIPAGIGFTILVTWAITYMLWPHAPLRSLVAWAILMTAINLVRLVSVLRRMHSPSFLSDPRRDARAVTVGLWFAGVGFAVGFLLFAVHAPLLEQYAITLFVVGLSAGAVTVLTGWRPAFVAYTAPIMFVVAVTMLWFGLFRADGPRGFLGLMMCLYAAGLLTFQKRLDRALLESIRLRFENENLVVEKDALLAELRLHNRELSADREAFLAASLTDGLTGLANRRHFDRTLARDWERSRRESRPLACVMLDLDHFKHYNDRYGHMAGDDCLRIVANIIAETVSRGGDFAARYGGEEFVLLLPGTDAAGAKLIADRIRTQVEARAITHAGGGPGRVVTLSAGVAAPTPGARHPSAQTLVDVADEALYLAKKRGRNRVVVRDLDEPVSIPEGLAPFER